MKAWATRLLLLGFVLAGAATPVLSAILLRVDVSNSAAVTFTATDNASAVNDTSARLYDGIDLVQFLTSAASFGYGSAFSGNLSPTVAHPASYSGVMTDVYPASRTAMNIFGGGTYQTDFQVFTTSAPAFTGVGTTDMSTLAELLPGPGASGNILAGFSAGGSHAVIGQWSVVPEPSMLVLAAGAAAMFLCRRRNVV